MAITAGTYLIYNARGEEIIFPAAGSISAGAKIEFGAGDSEPDNRVYWQVTVSGAANYIKNAKTGNAGFIVTNTAKTIVRQNKSSSLGLWRAVSTGRTLVLNGYGYELFNLKLNSDQTRLLTCTDASDYLEIAEAAEDEADAAGQEFAFVPSGLLDTKNLGTCSELTSSKNTLNFVDAASFVPYWQYSKTNLKTFQLRYRYRQQDENGVWGDWTSYMTPGGSMAGMGWANITGSAVKKTTGKGKKKKTFSYITSTTAIPTVIPDYPNSICTQIHVQVRARNGNTHGAIRGQTEYKVYATPSLTISDAVLSPSGLTMFFETNYTAEGTGITITEIKDLTKGVTILKNFEYEVQDYTGTIDISGSELYDIPASGDTIQIRATLTTTVSLVKKTIVTNLQVSYESGGGLSINPVYRLTDRLTYEASIQAYDQCECYIRVDDINGSYTLLPCEMISNDGTTAVFDIPAAFNAESRVLWVCVDGTDWTSEFQSVPAIESDCCSWYWYDSAPGAAIIKYKAEGIMQPGDTITTQAEEYITTGRQYPAFRFGRTLERNLDIEGAITDDEDDEYCLKQRFVELADAHHAVYRTPTGDWYNVAITGVQFERNKGYTTVTISQEAETV